MSGKVADVVRRMRAAGFSDDRISRTVRLPVFDVRGIK